mmetsp:Transcript_6780/g.14123  ORF Transcript_6780/g.14123 Transcript_6780/m.14123 type:complete len:243 (+) Transcript_6780:211-939(+)
MFLLQVFLLFVLGLFLPVRLSLLAHLLKYNRECFFRIVHGFHVRVVRVVEHLIELVPCKVRVRVEHLETPDAHDVRLHRAAAGRSVERLFFQHCLRDAIRSEVDIHFVFLSRRFICAVRPRPVEEKAVAILSISRAVVVGTVGADPKRVERVLVLEHVERFAHLAERHKHILNDVLLLVHFSDGLRLREFEEGHLGRHGPAQEQAKEGVVPDGNNLLKFPENRSGVSVVVVSERHYFRPGAA